MFVWHFTTQEWGWVGRVAICIGEHRFWMGRGSAITKGSVAFHNPILLGSLPSFWTIHCPSLCGFLSGLGVAGLAFFVWILLQWFSFVYASSACGFGQIYSAVPSERNVCQPHLDQFWDCHHHCSVFGYSYCASFILFLLGDSGWSQWRGIGCNFNSIELPLAALDGAYTSAATFQSCGLLSISLVGL